MAKKEEIIEVTKETENEVTSVMVSSLIHIIRGEKVILDSDLAMLYQIETGAMNRAVKHNKKRFPEEFCFRLTEEEFLRCQNGISKDEGAEVRGGGRYLPYAFTQQGILMLSAILQSDVAINVSTGIMRSFVEMRTFLATNSSILNRTDEFKQLEYQKSTDERFDKVFQYMEDHAKSAQKIFFDGQFYEAFSLIKFIIQEATKEIILTDEYVDVDTLNILAKKNDGVDVKIYTYSSEQFTNRDAASFNAQYPTLTVKKTQVIHDRYIILDGKTAYHIGSSIKDAGKKCFGISHIDEPCVVAGLVNRLKAV